MYARRISSEETYTLAEAKRIIRAEQSRKRQSIIAKAKQIAWAVLCLLLCAIIPYACDGDCTAWLIFIPCAVYFLLRKEI